MSLELTTRPRIAFVQLVKFNQDDNTFEGVMASSAPDQSGEILDWQLSRPHFLRWFNGTKARTHGKSLGAVREMHQPIAAGKIISAKFDDENERILVKGEIHEPVTARKVAAGVLSGLSIGGDYGKRWDDPSNPGLKRYEAKPYEVSLVDNPCNPDAQLTLVGSDGSEKMVKFVAASGELSIDEPEAPPDDLEKGPRPNTASSYAYAPGPNKSDWKYPIHDKAHVQNALSRFGQDKGIPDAARRKAWSKIVAAARRFGIDVKNPSYTAKGALMEPDEIVAQELQKQEQAKALKFAALGEIIRRVILVRKGADKAKRFAEKLGLSKEWRNYKLSELADAGGLEKSYVGTIAGYLNNLGDQLGTFQAAFTPAVAAGMPASPGKLQPGETVDDGDGSMVTATPSGSGTALMVTGAGVRAAAGLKGGKKGMKKKQLIKLLAQNNAALEAKIGKAVSDVLATIFTPPEPGKPATPPPGGAPAGTVGPILPTGGAPMRLVKDAPDAGKVAGAAAAAAADEVSEAEILTLQKLAADTSPDNAEAAIRAKVKLQEIGERAVKKALGGTATLVEGVAAGFRPIKTA